MPPRQHRLQGSATGAPPTQPSGPAPVPASSAPPPTPTENISSTPPSLLDKPAEPAKVDLASGSLTIHAENSSLVDILNRVKDGSGMTVNGLGNDQRIFGSYGPGDPQDVLYALLDGSGYNVVMLGRTETGTPKELSLTPRGAGGGAGAGGSHPQQQLTQDEDNDDEQLAQPIETPGAPQPDQPPQQPGVRTPQQMLQELQQMRQQQQLQLQQQQQQQSSPPQQQP